MFILFAVFRLTSVLFYGIDGHFDLSWTAESILMVIICAALYLSYHYHAKNVMKPLLGAALMLLFYHAMIWALDGIRDFDDYIEEYPDGYVGITYIGLKMAIFLILLFINILHYVINITHHSNPKRIKTNKLLYILFVIITVSQCVCYLFLDSGINNIFITDCSECVADVFMLNMVIVIESSLDGFRMEREARIQKA